MSLECPFGIRDGRTIIDSSVRMAALASATKFARPDVARFTVAGHHDLLVQRAGMGNAVRGLAGWIPGIEVALGCAARRFFARTALRHAVLRVDRAAHLFDGDHPLRQLVCVAGERLSLEHTSF